MKLRLVDIGAYEAVYLRYRLIGSPKDAVVYRGVNDLRSYLLFFTPSLCYCYRQKKFFTHLMSQSARNSLTWMDLTRLSSGDIYAHGEFFYTRSSSFGRVPAQCG
jgi:hypothetical protein